MFSSSKNEKKKNLKLFRCVFLLINEIVLSKHDEMVCYQQCAIFRAPEQETTSYAGYHLAYEVKKLMYAYSSTNT